MVAAHVENPTPWGDGIGKEMDIEITVSENYSSSTSDRVFKLGCNVDCEAVTDAVPLCDKSVVLDVFAKCFSATLLMQDQ